MAQVSLEQLERIVNVDSPWRSGSASVSHQQMIMRKLPAMLWQEIKHTPITERSCHKILMGPRRVGKTVAMEHISRRAVSEGVVPPDQAVFITMDEAALEDLRMDEVLDGIIDLVGARPERPAVVFMDEITKSRGWDKTLKRSYDKPDRYPVRIIGSSSSAKELAEGSEDSGAGRWTKYLMFPCLLAEFLEIGHTSLPIWRYSNEDASSLNTLLSSLPEGLKTEPSVLDAINDMAVTGGSPENFCAPGRSEESKARFLQARHKLIREVTRKVTGIDVAHSARVRLPGKPAALLRRAAEMPCGEISPKEWAEILEISKPTLEGLFEALDDAMLIFRLSNYAGKGARYKKVYFYDNAVPASESYQSWQTLQQGRERGWSLENLVASSLYELVKQSDGRAQLYHLRDQSREIDLVFQEEGHDPIAIEVGSARTKDLHNMKVLLGKDKFSHLAGNAYLVTPDAHVKKTGDVKTLPLAEFLLAVEARRDVMLADQIRTGRVV